MFEYNIDWEATKSIYESTDSIVDDGIIKLQLAFNGMVGIRRVLPSNRNPCAPTKPAASATVISLPNTNANTNNGREEEEKEEDDVYKIDSTFEYCILSLNFE